MMDVSSPIAAVIPSLDGGVLMALAGSTSAKSLNDVWHQTPGASKSGVRLALLRLASEGVVLQVPGSQISRFYLGCSGRMPGGMGTPTATLTSFS